MSILHQWLLIQNKTKHKIQYPLLRRTYLQLFILQLIFPSLFLKVKHRKQKNKIWWNNRPTECSRILMTRLRRAASVGWRCPGEIIPGLYRIIYTKVTNGQFQQLGWRSWQTTASPYRHAGQAWEIATTTRDIIYSCFLHTSHFRDDRKRFSERLTLSNSAWTCMYSLNIYWVFQQQKLLQGRRHGGEGHRPGISVLELTVWFPREW